METLNQIANIITASGGLEKAKAIAYAVLNVIMVLGSIACIAMIAINGVKMSKVEDEDQIKLAKKRVKYSILGLVLCVAALVIGNVIISLAEQIFK